MRCVWRVLLVLRDSLLTGTQFPVTVVSERKRRKSRKAVVNSGVPKINGTASQEQEADNTTRKDGEEYGAEKQQDVDSQNVVKLLSDKVCLFKFPTF